jgi:hypothetical protein
LFPNPVFYKHFVKLIKLINLCLQFKIWRTDVVEIQKGFAEWVLRRRTVLLKEGPLH